MVLYMSSQREIQKQNKISCETAKNAGVAQLVEQLICNQQVGGSNPSTSSNFIHGGFPEWPKGTDCKSAGNAFGGSNPPSPTRTSGCSRIRKSFFTIRRAAPTCPGNFPKDCRRVALFRATGGKKLPHGYNWEKTRRKNGEIWALRPLHRGGGCAIMPWHYVGKGRFS